MFFCFSVYPLDLLLSDRTYTQSDSSLDTTQVPCHTDAQLVDRNASEAVVDTEQHFLDFLDFLLLLLLLHSQFVCCGAGGSMMVCSREDIAHLEASILSPSLSPFLSLSLSLRHLHLPQILYRHLQAHYVLLQNQTSHLNHASICLSNQKLDPRRTCFERLFVMFVEESSPLLGLSFLSLSLFFVVLLFVLCWCLVWFVSPLLLHLLCFHSIFC